MGNKKLLHPNPVLLLLILLAADASISGKPQYMVLVPSLLHSGTPEKICLLLTQLNETVTVKASLDTIRENGSLFMNMVAEKDLFQCVAFTVPQSPYPEAVMFLTVEVEGPTHGFRSRKTVLVKSKDSLVFVQTDKPIYKPGQTVKARVVSLDENFRPLNELFPLIFIQDPKGNRVMQWQNLKLERGLTQLSFPLSSEPLLGSYSVVVHKESGGRMHHSFTVEEFVLPKFEVQVSMPKKITILEQEFTVSVCGRYTYGKPVPGNITMSICRNYNNPSACLSEESRAFCKKYNQQLNSQGCFIQQVKTNDFQLRRKEYEMRLRVEAKIREEGTGVQLTGTGFSEITATITKLSFVKVDSYVRPGVPFFGQVRLVDGKNVPMPHKMITITASEANYHSNATTDENGLVQFSINTTNMIGTSLNIQVKHKDSTNCYDYQWLLEANEGASHTANAVFSLSRSFVHLEPQLGKLPCHQTQTFKAHYILKGQELKELVFYYVIMAKGGIVQSGTYVLSVEQGNSESFSVSVPVKSDLAPVARVLIYAILPSGEIIADSAKYNVENCLDNKVNLSFSEGQSLPASKTHLRVTASPQSLCALRAVDQSVLLRKPEAVLSASSVYALLPVKDLTGFPGLLGQQEENDGECVSLYNTYIDGILYSPEPNINEKDMYGFLKDMGLKVFTNTKIQKPQLCAHVQKFEVPTMAYSYSESSSFRSGPRRVPAVGIAATYSEPPKETVRTYFPETWIWDLKVTDSSGVAEVEVTVPDTITEWKAGAFCLSNDTGLGLSPTASLRAFQPFFVELTMPYSVIRGEAFTLKATVLNYLPDCIRISVHLEASPKFLAEPKAKEQESYCVCGNERQTVSWVVTPKSLGNVNFTVSAEALESSELCGNEKTVVPTYGKKDTIIKPLLVEPEGIEKEETWTSLIRVSDTTVSEKLHLELPSNVIQDSARATVSILGDILGSAMQNIQNLLQMPYGCGEQNMVLFAPNIYVLDYLNETQQLTPDIKSKAISYLSTGYQRQLNYKHRDGSYSTFGENYRGGQGNTWLTAFVLKTFSQARKYIFIDEAHITQALSWLSQKQKDNGCFWSSGSLLNNAIKGGVEDEISLSAYITIALLEMSLPDTHPVVRNALFCLESAWKSAKEGTHGSHVYTKALLAYAFALAGNQERKKEILKSLEDEGVKEDNSLHWARPQKPKVSEGFLFKSQAPSAEVEMTSYVLLAYLTARPAPTPEDLTSATDIVNWVTKQQNSHGGYSSTQDTVVALHALSKYAAATFTRTEKAAQVTIKSSGTFSTNFEVNHNNRLLLQQVSLPTVSDSYTITVTGEGNVYLQTSLKYNVPSEKGTFPFALEAETVPQACDGPKAHTSFQISLNVSYIGSRPVSNMAIVDVKMVSGFIPLKPTVKNLEKSEHISRTEVSNNHVLIYLDKVSNQTLSLSFFVVQDIEVRDLKPAIIKVYDYYETNEFAIAEYHAPCSKDPGNA
uniref:Alpha-2-macroglobulin n=1 Tax=Cavia porcellus TaxID=10141 RepID=H0UT45_CAVPO